MKNSDMPAMPWPLTDEQWLNLAKTNVDFKVNGMTKREMMAMHMASGMLSRGSPDSYNSKVHLAKDCVECR
jgi:hypothetical protein